jgi:hypothetical protein
MPPMSQEGKPSGRYAVGCPDGGSSLKAQRPLSLALTVAAASRRSCKPVAECCCAVRHGPVSPSASWMRWLQVVGKEGQEARTYRPPRCAGPPLPCRTGPPRRTRGRVGRTAHWAEVRWTPVDAPRPPPHRAVPGSITSWLPLVPLSGSYGGCAEIAYIAQHSRLHVPTREGYDAYRQSQRSTSAASTSTATAWFTNSTAMTSL